MISDLLIITESKKGFMAARANAWLHAHFRVYVDGKTVVAIDNF